MEEIIYSQEEAEAIISSLKKAGVFELIGTLQNNEKALTLQLKLLSEFGNLQKCFRTSKIERYKFEHHVGCGRVDLFMVHKDGGLSIVEAKAENSLSVIAAGIGQLFVYEAAILRKSYKNPPKYINKILCVPVKIGKHPELELACANSGIQLVGLMEYSDFKKQIATLYA